MPIVGTSGNDVLEGTDVGEEIQGLEGGDWLRGNGGDDVLVGGAGDDHLDGGPGSDTYRFDAGWGRDTISNWEDPAADVPGNADAIVFGAGISAGDIDVWSDLDDLVLAHRNGQDTIRVYGYFMQTAARVEHILLADGSEWTRTLGGGDDDTLRGGSGGDVLTGLAGNDRIEGLYGDDDISGGAGNDQLFGGAGSDIYRFDLGWGSDTIDNCTGALDPDDIDAIVLGAGIDAGDVEFWRSNGDLILRHAGGGDQIRISGHFLGNLYQIDEVRFSDGTVWTSDFIHGQISTPSEGANHIVGTSQADIIDGLGGNDEIHGGAGDDDLTGGAGDDHLLGGLGSDTYRFDAGWGSDAIANWEDPSKDVPGKVDAIVFGAGISAGDITARNVSDDLIISHASGQDTIRVLGYFREPASSIEQILLADGSQWMRTVGGSDDDYLRGGSDGDVMTGFAGIDNIEGLAGNDDLNGGAGNDYLVGGTGSDLYRFDPGWGRDYVDNRSSATDVDAVVFGEGIAVADIAMSRSGAALVLDHANGSERVTITNHFSGVGYQIDEVRFADGTTWTAEQIFDRISTPDEGPNHLAGTTGNDVIDGLGGDDEIHGGAGDDDLTGGTGNDYLDGGPGSDTYRFDLGWGSDAITNWEDLSNDAPDRVDAIVFGEGISTGDIAVRNDSDNLVLTLADGQDTILVYGHFREVASRIAEIRFADGTTWDVEAIQTLADGKPLNVPPVITSDGADATAAVGIVENGTAVSIVTSVDEGDEAVYSIAGGVDAALFEIDGTSGALSFVDAPDFEAPADADGDNVYHVVVRVTDRGNLTDDQAIAVTIVNANDSAPVFTSAATATFRENDTGTTYLALASDVDELEAATFALSGHDAALFDIDGQTGAVSFKSPPDFENPVDLDGDNVYRITVSAFDGVQQTDHAVAITVADVDEGPVVVDDIPDQRASENAALSPYGVAGHFEAATALTFELIGAPEWLDIDSTSGVLSGTPGFSDAGVAMVTVRATDSHGITASTSFGIDVENTNRAPTRIALSKTSVAENSAAQTIVATLSGLDPDGPSGLSFREITDPDGKFVLVGDQLRLAGVLDFESRSIHSVTLEVSDPEGATRRETFTIAVTDVNEAPSIGGASGLATVVENTTAVTTITSSDPDGGTRRFSIVQGLDAALFAIDASSGVLSFRAAPDFELPRDSGKDNVYDLLVRVSDGSLSSTQAIAVTVVNANEAPVITSGKGATSLAVSVKEKATVVTTVAAADPEKGAIAYSVAGADASKFRIDKTTGVLAFKLAPDFEKPSDRNRDNVYEVTVSATDAGKLADSQAIRVTVTNVNEAPFITSGKGAAALAVMVKENATSVARVKATDPEKGGVAYSLSGTDAKRFVIDKTTGVLAFKAAPDFERPSDKGKDNVYDVTVKATDAGRLADSQAIRVTVADAAGKAVKGSGKAERFDGTPEDDRLKGAGGADIVKGGAGHDRIEGGGGGDVLDGGTGNDRIAGGNGADRMTGGPGADSFVFLKPGESGPGAATRDLILDFGRKQGDVIELAAIDARTGTGRDDRFSFIGEAAFSKKPGQLRYDLKKGKTFVYGDVDGDGAPDLAIKLATEIALKKADFIL